MNKNNKFSRNIVVVISSNIVAEKIADTNLTLTKDL